MVGGALRLPNFYKWSLLSGPLVFCFGLRYIICEIPHIMGGLNQFSSSFERRPECITQYFPDNLVRSIIRTLFKAYLVKVNASNLFTYCMHSARGAMDRQLPWPGR